MKKRSIFTLLGLLLVLTLVAACGGGAPATEAPAEKEAEAPAAKATEAPAEKEAEAPAEKMGPEGEVTLWHAYQTGSAEEETLTVLIDNAKAELPGLSINVLQIPFDQIFNKWQTEVAAGGGPDMFVAPNDDLGNLARGDLVMQLDALLKDRLDNVVQTGVDGMKVDGHLYGVPESAKAVALYYNKSLIDTPPATSDELMQAVQDGQLLVNVLGAYHLFGFSGSFGGQLLDGTNTCVADQGGWADAMQYLLDLKTAGAIFEPDYGKAEALFRNGEAAMFVNGPWALADYKADLGDDLGVAPIPAGSALANPLNGIDGFYINPNSQNAEAAVELALFLTNKESAQIYTDQAGHVPIRTDVKAADPLVGGFAEASSTGLPRPQSAEFGNYWGPFGDMFTKVLEGVSTPEEGVNEACANMNIANGKEVAVTEGGASGEVTLWHAYQTGSAEEETLATLIDNAKAELPGLSISVLQIPFDQIFNKWQTEVAAGGGPDMFVAPNDDLGNLARGDLVMQLDALLKDRLDNVVQTGVDGMKVDGHLYGVPESAKAVALYYNKSLIDTPPATSDELMQAVQDGQLLVNVLGAYHLFGFSGSFGGQLLDADGKCIADQGGWADAMQYLVDLKAAGAVFEPDYGKAEALFRNGEAAMFVNGPWALADYKADLGDDLGVAPIPAGTELATPLNGIDGFYVNPNSQNVEGAVELALFLTSKDSAQIYTDQAGHVPIRTDVEAADPLVGGFAGASATGLPRPQSVEFGNYWGPFGDMFTKVLEDVSTPEEGVNEACANMNTANEK